MRMWTSASGRAYGAQSCFFCGQDDRKVLLTGFVQYHLEPCSRVMQVTKNFKKINIRITAAITTTVKNRS